MDRGCRTTRRQDDRKKNGIERPTVEGASPVNESERKPSGILSTARHEKSCRKQAGPSVKAKYTQVTDSEPVP